MTLAHGTEARGMYQFVGKADKCHQSGVPSSAVCYSVSESNSLLLWHRRLGHPSLDVTKQVLKSNNISFSKDSSWTICQACQMGKSHKLPFVSSTTTYNKPFELVIADVWGPAPVVSSGYTYYISFVDAYSKFVWIYLLKRKSEALEVFKMFKTKVEVQFQTKIKGKMTEK